MSRFKRAKHRCRTNLPESEFVHLALNGLTMELRKKLEGLAFADLFELSTSASRYERLLKEEQERRKSSMGTYYRDPNYEIGMVDIGGKTLPRPV